MSTVREFEGFYKKAIISKLAYEDLTSSEKIKNIQAKYPQFKVLAHSTDNKPSGMQAMLLQDEKGEIFLSIRGSDFLRCAGL